MNSKEVKTDSVEQEIDFIKKILPDHYRITGGEENKHVWIRCVSSKGIVKPPYVNRVREQPNPNVCIYTYRNITVTDAEDEEHWSYIVKAIKSHFGLRFMEIDHNTNFCHVDFVIYLKLSSHE